MAKKKNGKAETNGAKTTGFPDGSYVDAAGKPFNADGSPMSAERAAELEVTSTAATATAEKPERARKRSEQGEGQGGKTATFHDDGSFELDAELGKVSIGKETVGVGAKFKRHDLPLEKADHYLCGAQLAISIREVSEQLNVFGDADPLSAVVEARSFRVTGDAINATLSFSRDDTDVEALSLLAQKSVRIVGRRTGAASVPPPPTRDIEFDEDHAD